VSQCLKENKATKTTTYFNSMEEFWTVCALLQIEKKYAPAEYWNLLNEFFNSVNLVFFISAIVAFSTGHWLIGIIYFVIAIATFYRAKQYAKQFVETVVRLMKAREELKNINYEQFI
jgi:magnesium-transporting ATPase (P-type)